MTKAVGRKHVPWTPHIKHGFLGALRPPDGETPHNWYQKMQNENIYHHDQYHQIIQSRFLSIKIKPEKLFLRQTVPLRIITITCVVNNLFND